MKNIKEDLHKIEEPNIPKIRNVRLYGVFLLHTFRL